MYMAYRDSQAPENATLQLRPEDPNMGTSDSKEGLIATVIATTRDPSGRPLLKEIAPHLGAKNQ